MKISSVSKKVLASALSAAMVVAFAPTVAFGATGDPIDITIDLAGGANAQTQYTGFKQGDTITLGSPTKDGYAIDHWYLDANGDGQQATDGSEANITPGNTTLPETATATYRAVYKVPTVTPAYTVGTATDADGNTCVGKINVALAANSAVKIDTVYTATIKDPSGTVLQTKEFKPASKGTAADISAGIVVEFAGNPLSTDTTQVSAETFLKSGKYTVVLNDGANDIVTKEVEVVKVTYKAANTADVVKFYEKSNFSLDSGTWVDANGFAVADGTGLTGDVVLTKSTATQTATGGTSAYNASSRVLQFAVADADTTHAEKATYAVSVADPSGAEIFATSLEAAASTALSSTNVAFSFNQSYNGPRAAAGATETAGDYVITVVKTVGSTSTTVKAKQALTEVKYDAGAGSFQQGVTGTDIFTTNPAGETLKSHNSTVLKAATGYEVDGSSWQLEGKNATAASLKAGKVNTLTAKYKQSAEKIATPVATVTEKTETDGTKNYYIKATCATAGAKIQVKVANDASWTDLTALNQTNDKYDAASGAIKVAKGSEAAKYQFQAIYVANATDPKFNGHDSDTLTLAKNAKIATWTGNTAGAAGTTAPKLETVIGKTSTKWLAADSVKAAIASGKAAIEGLGTYYTDATAADATELAQYKALYEAVVATANAELAKYAENTPVVVGDKAWMIPASALKTTTDAVAKDVKAVTDTKAENVVITTYTNAIDSIIPTVNAALKAAVESALTKSDIEAAQAVSTALKAATTGEAAEKALADYEALTAEQKKLVPGADIIAAQEVLAAAELKDAQDDAAVSKARNASKTVKAGKNGKTAKKQSVTLKAITSASGAKVTYKKSSGSSKVSVKSGKAYLAKGVKKGTYKATVKATCGTQTAKIKVTFKVK